MPLMHGNVNPMTRQYSIRYQVSGIRYQVSGILISPGEPLVKGYYKWHPEKRGKKYMYTKQTQKPTHKNGDVRIIQSN